MALERSWRLLPSESIVWQGAPVPAASRDLLWRVGPLLVTVMTIIAALFCALLNVAELPGSKQMAGVACYLGVLATSFWLAPRWLHDRSEYLITDKRVLWRRGSSTRWIDRSGLSYARVTWNAKMPGVGHLELVRATPYGPLSRKQRLMLHNLRAPDRVLAIVRGVEATNALGDSDLSLADRLDREEQVLWGGSPEGMLLGWRDFLSGMLGVVVFTLGLRYGARALEILVYLERRGDLQVRSWKWVLLFSAMALSWSVICAVGSWLIWRGFIFARALSRETEYMLTTQRVLIRRGRTELSLDRRAIVDVAVVPVSRGCRNLFLILDAPGARALSDSGALLPLGPARDLVPPVFYELRDADRVCALILPEADLARAA